MSFKFNFGESQHNNEALVQILNKDKFRGCRQHLCKKEVFCLKSDDFKNANVGDIQLFYLNPLIAEKRVEEKELKSVLETSDLKPGTYEGGFKVWECTFDLLGYLNEHKTCMLNKKTLDLGCGSGLLGLFAYFSGAKTVSFQDYNSEVIEEFTLPGVRQSFAELDKEELEKLKFYSGDWDDMSFFFSEQNEESFDLILSSETIYNVEYYPKLLRLLKEHLSPNGVAYFAAKTHYFGVGGGTLDFLQFLRDHSNFFVNSIVTNHEGLCREILKISKV